MMTHCHCYTLSHLQYFFSWQSCCIFIFRFLFLVPSITLSYEAPSSHAAGSTACSHRTESAIDLSVHLCELSWACVSCLQTEKLTSLSGVSWRACQQIGLFAAGIVYMKNLILAWCYMSLKRIIRASCVVCAGKSVASQKLMAFVLFRMWNGLSHCNINLNKISHQSLEISSWDANW